jgi:hypothetical protein
MDAEDNRGAERAHQLEVIRRQFYVSVFLSVQSMNTADKGLGLPQDVADEALKHYDGNFSDTKAA